MRPGEDAVAIFSHAQAVAGGVCDASGNDRVTPHMTHNDVVKGRLFVWATFCPPTQLLLVTVPSGE